MSVNGFFYALSSDDIDAIMEDDSLISEWMMEKSIFTSDVDSAWHVLSTILKGAAILAGEILDSSYSAMTPEDVAYELEKLSKYSHDDILKGIRSLQDEEEISSLNYYKENEPLLLNEFDKLVAFFKKAASQDLGAVSLIT